MILILDEHATIRDASPAAELAWGYSADVLHGASVLQLVDDREQSEAINWFQTVLQEAGGTHCTADGGWREVNAIATNLLDRDAVGGVVVTCCDVTDRNRYERQLKELAFHDAVTGLPNRTLLSERLERALVHAERGRQSIGLLFLDLDNFKVVNDSLGHQRGDELLREVAARLLSTVRAEDTVARIGGDEFTVLCGDAVTLDAAQALAQRLTARLREPIVLCDREIAVGASIGIALSSPGQDDPESLLRKADLAMYSAKRAGKARHAVFDESMQSEAVQRLDIESDLRAALERGDFRVHYQPIVSLEDGRTVGVEALVRWEHPTPRAL